MCKLISHAFDSCDLHLSALDASHPSQCCADLSQCCGTVRCAVCVSDRIMPKIKKKQKRLNDETKLKIIEELKEGASRTKINLDYNVPKSTISDINRDQKKIIQRRSAQDRSGSSSIKDKVDKDILDWFSRQTSNELPVLGIELEKAARDIASEKKAVSYNVHKGWLQKFCRKYDIELCKVSPFLKTTETTNIDEFRKNLLETTKELNVSENAVYVAKAFGLLWRNLSCSISGFEDFKGLDKFKEDRFATMLCANADGSHKLNPLVVGKCGERTTRSGQSYTETRVNRRSQDTAWITTENFLDWFKNIFVPEVTKFQGNAIDDVKAILVIDDGASIPKSEKLSFISKGIICLRLPSAASTVLPLSQGIFEACKRAYKLKLVSAILIDNERSKENIEKNLRKYTIETAFSNWASSWEEVERGHVHNAWSKLLGREDADNIQKGHCESEFQSKLRKKLKFEVPKENILEWLNAEMENPIYQFIKPNKSTQTKMDKYITSSKIVPSTSQVN